MAHANRSRPAHVPSRVFEAQQYGDFDTLSDRIEQRAEQAKRERALAKARRAKIGIRQFSFES